MKLRNIILGIACFPSILFALAQENPVIASPLENILSQKTQAVLLARVNLYEPSIAWNKKANGYIASFTLETEDPVQRGVRYRIGLLDKDGVLVYAHVFDDSVTLVKSIPLTITKNFPVPLNLSGTYEAVISVVNKEGLPLTTGRVSKVTFGSDKESSFAVSGCSLDKSVYDKQEKVVVTCKVSGKPGFGSTLDYAAYRGNRAQSFFAGKVAVEEKKTIFSFPAPAKPSAYTIYIQGTENGAIVGKTSLLQFAVRGPINNILSLYVDRQSYRKGEAASVAVGLSLFVPDNKAVFAEANLTDINGIDACSQTSRVRINKPSSASFSLPIIKNCDGFVLSVRLLDSKGFVLDEEVLSVDKEAGSRFIGFLNVFLLISALIVVLSSFVHKRHAQH